MALFSRTKKTAEAPEKKTPAGKGAPLLARASAILALRVTEKATKESEQNTYTFNVRPDATKTEIREAVKGLYKVDPLTVKIVPVRAKALFQRGKRGRTSAGKKAYVTLKKGDHIEFT
ncbi:MAG TPA: 50S ribosomal protein L23 [Candidatus Paceibacterota bacterium]|nr:50S ribosomal protein L23 [Candidatus Paceibacterota bacterium]